MAVGRKRRTGTFAEFRAYTLDVVRGRRKVGPGDPKVWAEPARAKVPGKAVNFRSLEAGAKLLSPGNRRLLEIIASRHPQSVAELATMSGRHNQNLSRTLQKLRDAGIIRMAKGEGRKLRPELLARKIFFEVDLVGTD
jgi:predicted transcriptional regulator